MIRVQKLKQPKKTSGKKLEPGVALKIEGVTITNTTKHPLWVDTYKRKPLKEKSSD